MSHRGSSVSVCVVLRMSSLNTPVDMTQMAGDLHEALGRSPAGYTNLGVISPQTVYSHLGSLDRVKVEYHGLSPGSPNV